jgi:hypothetical protein
LAENRRLLLWRCSTSPITAIPSPAQRC